MRQSGETEIAYEATYSGDPIVVREVGLKLTLPGSLHNLSWRRWGQWTVYPGDHIGRLVGEAIPFPVAEGDPRPSSWSHDYDPRGCNDFRSTKYDVLEASLTDAEGRGIAVRSSGNQHIRAQVAGDEVLLYVLDFANGGGERFLRSHYQGDSRTVNPGDTVSGTVHLGLVRPESDAR